MADRLFELHRQEDVTGVSGTGIVATGVEFDDGTVVIRWRGEMPSTVIRDSISDAIKVHGHGGATVFRWVGESETVHACPPDDGVGVVPCCVVSIFDLPRSDRMTDDPAFVTCLGYVPAGERVIRHVMGGGHGGE